MLKFIFVGKALRHTNNEMNDAIDAMNESPEILLADYEESDEVSNITKEMIETVANMGFDRDIANKALKRCKGNLEQALDLLTKHPEVIAALMENEEEDSKKTQEARERMEEDLGDEDDHLDVTLEDEGTYLDQYKKLMKLI